MIIPAAGHGSRMGSRIPKQFLELDGVPILIRTVRVFLDLPEIFMVVVPVASDRLEQTTSLFTRFFSTEQQDRITVTSGGLTRQDSVRAGVTVLPDSVNVVLVHDGARPLVGSEIIQTCLTQAAHGAVIAAVQVKDTLKKVKNCCITRTVDRQNLYQAQTPQGAQKVVFEKAFVRADLDSFSGTDEASLFEHAGITVTVVPGSEENIKITRPEDLDLAQAIIDSHQQRNIKLTGKQMKIGHGFDAHRLVRGRKFILGGVSLDYELGLLGHSDADVLVHALIDAILGSLGKGDIGSHFPDTNSRYKNISSLELLERVIEIVDQDGYVLGNCDVTVICQNPKLASYLPQMRKNLADTCRMPEEDVNIKATTTEKMGYTGRSEGISAHAVVLLLPAKQ